VLGGARDRTEAARGRFAAAALSGRRGIAVMGIQRITFGWYVRHISFPALLGYAAGALTYLALATAGAGS
jgi:hypothetical protein